MQAHVHEDYVTEQNTGKIFKIKISIMRNVWSFLKLFSQIFSLFILTKYVKNLKSFYEISNFLEFFTSSRLNYYVWFYSHSFLYSWKICFWTKLWDFKLGLNPVDIKSFSR